jgi:hypothetical protein
MNTTTKKIASLLSTLTASASLALFGSGCVIDASADIDGTPTVVDTSPAIAEVYVDPGATMSTNPGEGVGLFVEYAGGGHWDVYTTCDTYVSGAACNFDVIITSNASRLANVAGYDLSVSDDLSIGSDGSIQLVTDTDYGMNGVGFDIDPGATIEVDVLLDGISQPEFIYAVSDGVLLSGMPSNPVDFTPSY